MRALFLFALLSTVLSEQVVEITNDVGEVEDSVEVVVETNDVSDKLLIFTVASEANDAYYRFVRSLRVNNLDDKLTTLGMNQKWLGGQMDIGEGGGYKVNLLKAALEPFKDDTDTIIMFTDSYDVVFVAGKDEIVKKFKETGSNIVISAEDLIWPDLSLKSKYPMVKKGKRFLCSGAIIGYAASFWNLVNYKDTVSNTEDDQLFYTHAYIDPDFREANKISLDSEAKIFQNLNGASEEMQMGFGSRRMTNTVYGSMPTVLHGNGPSKIELNRISNYYPAVFDPTVGDYGLCEVCSEHNLGINETKPEELPVIVTALYVTERTPFIDQFINRTLTLNYTRARWHVRVYNMIEEHDGHIQELLNYHTVNAPGPSFASVDFKHPKDLEDLELMKIFDSGLAECVSVDCDWYFAIESVVTLTDPNVLMDLMNYNVSVITTQLSQVGQYWSNFWGQINNEGFYRRSSDYFQVVERKRRSLWNVPFISSFVGVRKDTIAKGVKYSNNKYSDSNYDVAFARNIREKNVFMYCANLKQHGHLKRMDNYTNLHVHNDLWQIFVNPEDWKVAYIHTDYAQYLKKQRKDFPQPCPDVYQFPLVSERFSWHLIHELESIENVWSGGKNTDGRLAGGYEHVPTVDVHFTQINFQQEWLKILADYIIPMQMRVFEGYKSKSEAYLSFVVKYSMNGQKKLIPHHDASTFTTNTALNRAHIDYTGGGSYFIRQNCGVEDVRIGWTLIHPGRLSHYHAGKEITNGTRYILVSFNDP